MLFCFTAKECLNLLTESDDDFRNTSNENIIPTAVGLEANFPVKRHLLLEYSRSRWKDPRMERGNILAVSFDSDNHSFYFVIAIL